MLQSKLQEVLIAPKRPFIVLAALVVIIAIGVQLYERAGGHTRAKKSPNTSATVGMGLDGVHDGPDKPNNDLTPGAIDVAVTQVNIDETICVHGYSAGVRPSTDYTGFLKHRQMDYQPTRYLDKNPVDFEEDHLIPLDLGGAPKDEKNLWPEHWSEPWGARTKDKLENALHRRVCLPPGSPNRISLTVAQHAIAVDWIAAYRAYVSN